MANEIRDEELDRYYPDPNETDAEPVHTCCNCDEPIFEGDAYFDIPSDGIYCERCVDSWRCIA